MEARAKAMNADEDAYAELEAFFEMAAGETPPTPTASADAPGRPTVFADTMAFTVAALQRVKALQPFLEFDTDTVDRVVSLKIPDSFRERSAGGGRASSEINPRFMPPEAEPQDGKVRLTDNRSLMNDRIKAARQGAGGGWPEFQYLWDVHPAVDWLADKVGGVFGRRNAPVARLKGILAADEVAFVFNGIVPNLKGQPLVDEWPVVVFSGGTFARVERAADFLARAGLGKRDIPNIGATRVDDLQALVPEAVQRAQTSVHEARKAFQSAMDDELLRLDERLEALRGRHRQRIADLFQGMEENAMHRGRKAREEAKVEATFNAWWEWIKKTRETPSDPNPYVRLVVVFRG